MRTKEEIKQLVQSNIHQIKISEFVSEGGWPDIDNIDIVVFSQRENDDIETINLHILYSSEKAGCCFIPGVEEQKILPKTVTIDHKNSLIIS